MIKFPPRDDEGPRCVICKLAITFTKEEKRKGLTRTKCFCCENTIPLPLSVPEVPCPDCDGTGAVEVTLTRKDYTVVGVREEACMGCRGTGRKKR